MLSSCCMLHEVVSLILVTGGLPIYCVSNGELEARWLRLDQSFFRRDFVDLMDVAVFMVNHFETIEATKAVTETASPKYV